MIQSGFDFSCKSVPQQYEYFMGCRVNKKLHRNWPPCKDVDVEYIKMRIEGIFRNMFNGF